MSTKWNFNQIIFNQYGKNNPPEPRNWSILGMFFLARVNLSWRRGLICFKTPEVVEWVTVCIPNQKNYISGFFWQHSGALPVKFKFYQIFGQNSRNLWPKNNWNIFFLIWDADSHPFNNFRSFEANWTSPSWKICQRQKNILKNDQFLGSEGLPFPYWLEIFRLNFHLVDCK